MINEANATIEALAEKRQALQGEYETLIKDLPGKNDPPPVEALDLQAEIKDLTAKRKALQQDHEALIEELATANDLDLKKAGRLGNINGLIEVITMRLGMLEGKKVDAENQHKLRQYRQLCEFVANYNELQAVSKNLIETLQRLASELNEDATKRGYLAHPKRNNRVHLGAELRRAGYGDEVEEIERQTGIR